MWFIIARSARRCWRSRSPAFAGGPIDSMPVFAEQVRHQLGRPWHADDGGGGGALFGALAMSRPSGAALRQAPELAAIGRAVDDGAVADDEFLVRHDHPAHRVQPDASGQHPPTSSSRNAVDDRMRGG